MSDGTDEGRVERPSIWRRMRLVLFLGAGVVVAALIVGPGLYINALGPAPLGRHLVYSHLVVDRNGKLLRAYATPEGRWRLPATVKDVDPRFLELLFAYEDKRFYGHGGVDPLAMMRAAWQWMSTGHIVSGGSTLTMQVARLLEPRRHRSIEAKLRQIVRALELEHALNKKQILSLYLTLAPYGGNLEGVRAASLAYFGKEPRHLTLAQAALLVALPQSPESRRPDRHAKAAREARNRVLDRVAEDNVAPADEIAHAKTQAVPHARQQLPMLAPHTADKMVSAHPQMEISRLTIEAPLQKSLQALARERAQALGPHISVAILAVDNATGEVRASVGSAGYFDAERAGQVDMTDALRSPGSTLKPFIYGMAFEDGLIHPETLIDDIPQRFGSYKPENFDLTFQGTVTVRRALQWSLNVPAIAVLTRVGVSRLDARLTGAGAALVLPQDEAPGLAMGLGGVGIRLSDLVKLYAGLARLGTVVPLIEQRRGKAGETRAGSSIPVAAWYVGNILIGAPPPENAPRWPHRLQDRHLLRLPRRLGGGFRRPHDHRRLGRPPRRHAGARAGGARVRRAHPVRRLRPHRLCPGAAAAAAQGGGVLDHRQAAAAPAALQPGKGRGRGRRRAAHHVPAQRRAAGTRRPARGSRAGGAQAHRRARAAHGHGQWRAASGAARAPDRVLPARRARFRAADGDGRPRRQRQRHGAAAISPKPANDSPGAWLSFCFVVAFPDGEPVSTSPGNALWSAPAGGLRIQRT